MKFYIAAVGESNNNKTLFVFSIKRTKHEAKKAAYSFIDETYSDQSPIKAAVKYIKVSKEFDQYINLTGKEEVDLSKEVVFRSFVTKNKVSVVLCLTEYGKIKLKEKELAESLLNHNVKCLNDNTI